MSKFYYKKVLPRYSLVVAIMTCIALAVLGKAFYTMTAGRAYWMAVASQQKRDSVKVMPLRGNILSCDGQLMASSLPEFKMYMDFDALKKAGNDTAFVQHQLHSQGLEPHIPATLQRDVQATAHRRLQEAQQALAYLGRASGL